MEVGINSREDAGRLERAIISAFIAGCLIFAVGLLLALWQLPAWLLEFDTDGERLSTAERVRSISSMRQMILWIAGGIIAIVTLILTWRRDKTGRMSVAIDRDANYTDRYTAAVRQLGDESFAIRLGGIYALERIARDSPRDRQAILNVLAAFLRRSAPAPSSLYAKSDAAPEISIDIQAAGYVLGQISQITSDASPINLSYTRLLGVDFRNADLPHADFRHSMLNSSDFSGANLADAKFAMSDLTIAKFVNSRLNRVDAFQINGLNADFSGAICRNIVLNKSDLSGANFDSCCLESAKLINVKHMDTIYRKSSLRNADFTYTDLSKADFDGADCFGMKPELE